MALKPTIEIISSLGECRRPVTVRSENFWINYIGMINALK